MKQPVNKSEYESAHYPAHKSEETSRTLIDVILAQTRQQPWTSA